MSTYPSVSFVRRMFTVFRFDSVSVMGVTLCHLDTTGVYPEGMDPVTTGKKGMER